MATLTIHFDHKTSNRFPVYRQYPGQYFPQPAYLELDIRTGDLDANFSSDIGGGVPATVWHNLVLRFTISNTAHKDDIAKFIADCADDFQTVLDGAEVQWNGNNLVGMFTKAAQSTIDRVNDRLNDGSDFQRVMIHNVAELLNGDVWPKPGQSINDFIDDLMACDGDYDSWFIDDLVNNPDAFKDELLEIWADCLYSGEDIPANIAQALIEAGTCDDSAWMDQLTTFANAK